jgi:Nodulation protein Z (NodZ)
MAYHKFHAASEDMLEKYSLSRSFHMTSADHRATSAVEMPVAVAVQQFLDVKSSTFTQEEKQKHRDEDGEINASLSRRQQALAERAIVAIKQKHNTTSTGLATTTSAVGEKKGSIKTSPNDHKRKKIRGTVKTATPTTPGKQSNRTSTSINVGGKKAKLPRKATLPTYLIMKRIDNVRRTTSLRDAMAAQGPVKNKHWWTKILNSTYFALSDDEPGNEQTKKTTTPIHEATPAVAWATQNASKENSTGLIMSDSDDNNVSFVHYQGCCGIGHRLARMSSAYHASRRLQFAMKGNWPSCQKTNVFQYLFETTVEGYLEPPTPNTLRSAQVVEVYNEVPGYFTVARPTSTTSDIANTCDACQQEKIDSDYQFYNLLMRNFRKRQQVLDFMEQQEFANHTVIGMHVRAGNGESGDFVHKGRAISDLVKFVDRVSAQLVNLTKEFTTPPLVFLATDTGDVANMFREILSIHKIPLVTLPQIRATQGDGILFGAKKKRRRSRREKDIQRRLSSEESIHADLDADEAEEDPVSEEQLQNTSFDGEAKEIEPVAKDLHHANHSADSAAGDGAVGASHRAGLPLTSVTEETRDCLSTWDQAFMDMMLIAMSDVVVATRRSSFVQTLPLSIVTGTTQAKRKVASPYCEISQDDSLQLTCHESYMDWCCCASCVEAEDKERLQASKSKHPLEYIKQLRPDLREKSAEELYEPDMKSIMDHFAEQVR